MQNHTFKAFSLFLIISENIRVLRHPNTLLPILWSHHEKLVIIDQKVAFMGGLDICHGRFDTHEHWISDEAGDMFPGIDYCN